VPGSGALATNGGKNKEEQFSEMWRGKRITAGVFRLRQGYGGQAGSSNLRDVSIEKEQTAGVSGSGAKRPTATRKKENLDKSMNVTVAIVGRPNVGKSTLFNRLVGKKIALVDDTPGVTRDRREAEGRIAELRFRLLDTAGFEDVTDNSLEARMRAQTEAAISEADIILFMVDARAGIVPLDERFGQLLRKANKRVHLIANKAESSAADVGISETYSLGFGEPIALSAEHGLGISELYSIIGRAIDEATEEKEHEQQGNETATGMNTAGVSGSGAERPTATSIKEATEEKANNVPLPKISTDVSEEVENADESEEILHFNPNRFLNVAIVGRPNAGKSTLVNRLVGEERVLTGPEAGITRDSILVPWEWEGRVINLVDTAGIRRRAKVQKKLEKLAVSDALRSIQYAEIVVLMLDATKPFEKQDLHLADLVEREGRALVIALNKWDLIKDKNATLAHLKERCERLLPQLRGVPLVTLSGLKGKNIPKLMQAIFEIERSWNIRIATSRLNRWLNAMVEAHPPPAVSGRRLKLRYMTQAKSRPPSFILFCSRPEVLPMAYKRYLINGLRESFDIWGSPVRLWVRGGDNPYADKAKKR